MQHSSGGMRRRWHRGVVLATVIVACFGVHGDAVSARVHAATSLNDSAPVVPGLTAVATSPTTTIATNPPSTGTGAAPGPASAGACPAETQLKPSGQATAIVTNPSCVTKTITAQSTDDNTLALSCPAQGIQHVLGVPNVATLDLSSNPGIRVEDLSLGAPALRTLMLENCQLTSLQYISLPPLLEALSLSLNPKLAVVDLSKTSLKRLLMVSNSISDLTSIKFPKTLTSLNLGYNELTSFQPPDSLASVSELVIGTNKFTSFKNIAIPSQVTSLDVTWNRLDSFEGLKLPSTLNMLYLGGNYFQSFEEFAPPSNLTMLYLDDLPIKSFKNLKIPDSVGALSLSNTTLSSWDDIVLPSSLQYLDVSGNQLKTIPKKYPDSMLRLNASGNAIAELNTITFPSEVNTLDFSGNPLTRVVGVVFSPALTSLSFGKKTTLTEFEISQTDYTRFNQLTVLDVATSIGSCGKNAELKTVRNTSLCVLSDEAFRTKYGLSPSAASTSSHGKSSSWILPLVIAIALGMTVALIVVAYRSRRAKRFSKMQTLADHSVFDPMTEGSGGRAGYNAMFSGTALTSGGSNSGNAPENSLLKFRIPTNEVVIQHALNKGGFGIVYLATYQEQDVVVKKILPEKASDDRCLNSFVDEIKLCSTLSHPKVVRFVGVSWNTLADIAVIMEFMSNGDLDSLLKKQLAIEQKGKPSLFDWYNSAGDLPSKSVIALDILEAVVYLHSFSSPIIHRDLKAKNVLLSSSYEAKLSDFGVSKEWRVDQTMTGGIGTMAWIAPEVLRGERYTEKADIYSFGVVLTELSTCRKPFDGVTNALIVLKVTSGDTAPDMGENCPDDIRDLAMRCLSFDANERPSAMVAHYELKTLLKAHTAFEL